MKQRYTQSEAHEIRSLLREKTRAGRDRQKSIRARLREIGFDISLYSLSSEAFRVADFDELVDSGQLEICSDISTDGRGG